MAEQANAKIITPVGRLSFPNIVERNNKGKYALSLIFPAGTDLSALKAAAGAAAKDRWGDNPPANLKTPFRSGAEKDFDGYDNDSIFISCSTKRRPGVVDANNQPLEDEDAIREALYPGCYVRVSVNAFAYDQDGNRGVSFGLRNIQKIKDGEELGGGGGNAQEDFGAAPAPSGDFGAPPSDGGGGVDYNNMF